MHIDPPKDAKDYLHRAGRTARAGESGAVATLVLPNQRRTTLSMMHKAGVPTPGEHRLRATDEKLVELTGAREPSGTPVVDEPQPRTTGSRGGGQRGHRFDRSSGPGARVAFDGTHRGSRDGGHRFARPAFRDGDGTAEGRPARFATEGRPAREGDTRSFSSGDRAHGSFRGDSRGRSGSSEGGPRGLRSEAGRRTGEGQRGFRREGTDSRTFRNDPSRGSSETRSFGDSTRGTGETRSFNGAGEGRSFGDGGRGAAEGRGFADRGEGQRGEGRSFGRRDFAAGGGRREFGAAKGRPEFGDRPRRPRAS